MKQRLISAGILLAIVITCVFVSDITRVLFFGAAGILVMPLAMLLVKRLREVNEKETLTMRSTFF